MDKSLSFSLLNINRNQKCKFINLKKKLKKKIPLFDIVYTIFDINSSKKETVGFLFYPVLSFFDLFSKFENWEFTGSYLTVLVEQIERGLHNSMEFWVRIMKEKVFKMILTN